MDQGEEPTQSHSTGQTSEPSSRAGIVMFFALVATGLSIYAIVLTQQLDQQVTDSKADRIDIREDFMLSDDYIRNDVERLAEKYHEYVANGGGDKEQMTDSDAIDLIALREDLDALVDVVRTMAGANSEDASGSVAVDLIALREDLDALIDVVRTLADADNNNIETLEAMQGNIGTLAGNLQELRDRVIEFHG